MFVLKGFIIILCLGYGIQPGILKELPVTVIAEGRELMKSVNNEVKTQTLQFRPHQSKFTDLYYYNRLAVPFDSHNCHDECTTNQQCQIVAGSVTGSCFMNSYIPGVCCKAQQSCGKTTTDIVSLFSNPHYPNSINAATNCEFTMFTLTTTCGVRLDFLDTTLIPSLDGSCYADVIIILLNPPFRQERYNTPFCGPLNGHSTLIQVNGSAEVKVIATTQSDQAMWNIRLTQINCADVKLPDSDPCGFSNVNLRRTSKNKLSVNKYSSYTNSFSKKDINKIDKLLGREMNLMNKTRSNAKIKNLSKHELSDDNLVESVSAKIINGQEALVHEYPWMVVLLLDNELNCGGSLISHDWVVTAGHCIQLSANTVDIKRFAVLLGAHNISRNEEQRRILRFVINIVQHPSYQGANYDIALLRLREGVRYNVAIRPVCLPNTLGNTFSADPPIVAGWGKDNTNTLSDVLRAVSIPLVPDPICQAAWSATNVQLLEFMLCAGAPGIGSCNGDSGGPLVAHDEDELYYIIGITSFGAKNCDPRLHVPDVFTKVTYFLDWISLVLVGS